MKYADLHIHSSYSDGAYTPEEIIDIARKNEVKYISITDHDSIGGQYINSKGIEDIKIISGDDPVTVSAIATYFGVLY